MAAKRVAATALDWGVLTAKIPAENKAAFSALKMKVDKHLRAVNHLPAALPALDFEAYRSKIAVAGMVDNFEKQYKALEVPYPSDQGKLGEIDAQAVQQKARFTKFVADSNARITGYSSELAKWEAMMPVEEMTLEEALDSGLTQFVVDPDVPTLFPHDQTWEEYAAKLEKATPHDFH